MKKDKKFKYLIIVLLCIFIFFSGVISIDASFGAFNVGVLTGNGFLSRAPAKQYHIGLWMVILSMFFINLLLLHMLFYER